MRTETTVVNEMWDEIKEIEIFTFYSYLYKNNCIYKCGREIGVINRHVRFAARL